VTPPALLQAHAGELEQLAGVQVELIEAPPQTFVLIHGMPLPSVYTHARCTALLQTDALYPRSAMDMFWLDPQVGRADGRPPAGTESVETYLGRSWRRYSWHRNGVWSTAGNPLLDHYEFMQARLAMELAA
jgi:E2/UBC family protein E